MNNGLEQVDYVIWNDELSKLSWETINQMGEPRQQINYPLDLALRSSRYFKKASSDVNFLYKVRHENNFIKKEIDSLTFLE
ncbi:MAG: hypothetical protein ACKO96_46430, partial [Flammeovirgaceae bacterium]